jgi:hypothetical protein
MGFEIYDLLSRAEKVENIVYLREFKEDISS